MKRSRFSETEIVYAVKQVEAGVPVAEVARKYGVSQETIYLVSSEIQDAHLSPRSVAVFPHRLPMRHTMLPRIPVEALRCAPAQICRWPPADPDMANLR